MVVPNRDPSIGPNPAPARSLVEELAEVADDLRQLNTDFGLRPYRVFSVVIAWSGGVVGRGIPSVHNETEFLPTPLVDIAPIATVLKSGGRVEEGSATLREISPRYTEPELHAICCPKLGKGQEAFVEVRIDARDGQRTERRRFAVRGAPYRKAGQFEWLVKLSRQQQDRKPDGQPDERTELPERLLNPLMGERE